jgi:hypothetical protein
MFSLLKLVQGDTTCGLPTTGRRLKIQIKARAQVCSLGLNTLLPKNHEVAREDLASAEEDSHTTEERMSFLRMATILRVRNK